MALYTECLSPSVRRGTVQSEIVSVASSQAPLSRRDGAAKIDQTTYQQPCEGRLVPPHTKNGHHVHLLGMPQMGWFYRTLNSVVSLDRK